MKDMSQKGFTLIEMIVSIAIFTIVITIAMSAYLSLISLDRRARATNDVVTNLSFVVDSMSRSIRTGSQYKCGGTGTNCASPNTAFSFLGENGQTMTYLLKQDGTIGACSSGACTTTSASSITDPRITINTLAFYVAGVGLGDGMQPRVTFTMKGSIKPDPQSPAVEFTIESGATQRLLEI